MTMLLTHLTGQTIRHRAVVGSVSLGGHHRWFFIVSKLELRLGHQVLEPVKAGMSKPTVPQQQLFLIFSQVVVVVVQQD